MWDKLQLWWAYQSLQQSPRMVTFSGILGCSSKQRWQDPRGLVWQCGAVAVHDCPLNCHSGGLRWLMSTFFPGRTCPHICEGIYWWQINMDFWLTVEKMWLPQAHLYPCFLVQALAPNCMNTSRVSIHWPLFSCQWQPDLSDLGEQFWVWN